MAVHGGPKISATNGLILSFDIANSKSYVGFGNTVNDLVNQTTNELSIQDSFYKIYDPIVADYVIPNSPPTNLPISDSNNFGNVIFDGIGNALKFSTPPLGSTITVEMWIKLGSDYSNNMLLSFGSYTIWCLGGGLGFNTSNNDLYGISSATVSSLGLLNQWKQYIFEMRTDVSYTNNKIYINTQNQSLSQQVGTESSSGRKFDNINCRISTWANTTGYEMPMSLSLVRIYNRSLTAAEISNNFNLGRSRFGI
jgi:hypothetical protein